MGRAEIEHTRASGQQHVFDFEPRRGLFRLSFPDQGSHAVTADYSIPFSLLLPAAHGFPSLNRNVPGMRPAACGMFDVSIMPGRLQTRVGAWA